LELIRLTFRRLLILGDWYHKVGSELGTGLLQRPFRWMGDPDSILHNGKV
jgi:hypothetical protein